MSRAAYRKLGPRYPMAVADLVLAIAHFAVAAGIGLLLLYQPLGGDWWKLLLVSQVLILVENVGARRLFARMVAPAQPWLAGDRSPAAASDAWNALASLPARWIKAWKKVPLLFNLTPFCAYAVWELELPAYSFAFLFAGGVVVTLYGLFLRFFILELALRPVVEDASCDLDASFAPSGTGMSLRTRLLYALAMLNIITGVTVAGLSTSGTASLEDLGLDVAVAVVVAFTIAFELSLLLSASISVPIDRLRRATEQVAAGDLDVRVPVATTDETGALAQSFNAMVAGLRDRERLREAFGAYVDPALAERVLTEGVALEGEEVEVTVCFIDIRDFTALAERSSAREVVALLNEFFEAVVPVLARHGGHANKFVGDGLLGVFGAPQRHADHADRGLAAAIEIALLTRERWGERLRIGIGVNSGPVVAGTLGGGGRVEFGVIGDAVNTAARVEEATRISGDEVLVTAATCALLARRFRDVEPRPAIPLKGKSETVRLFAPKALTAAAAPAARQAALP